MKIYIGPYPDTWWRSRIHSNYMDKKYDYDWQDNHNNFEKYLEKFEDILQSIYNVTINQIVKHRKQKRSIHIDSYDTWNMDNTLAHIILPMLKQLQSSKHGAPLVDDEDVPDHLKSTAADPKENEWDTDSNHFKRWDWVMKEMIHAFECEIDEDWEDQFHTGEIDHIRVPEILENGTRVWRVERGPNDTHVFDREGYDKAWARRNNAMRLFGKYYHSLWD